MVYRGYRFGGRCVVTRDGKKVNPRLDLFNHSPSGFEWGYGGSGPAQTALAILADFLHDDDRAVLLHQKFKWDVISKMPHKDWRINEVVLRGWLKLHEDVKDALDMANRDRHEREQ
jgi:hypothetical protein